MWLLPLFVAAALVQGQGELPRSDPRIRVVPYVPDQIVTLGVVPGFASVIELAVDERADTVVVGNSGDWQVTTNRSGSRIIVKPLAGASATDMIVLTAERRYLFVLDPYADPAFVMSFSYATPPVPPVGEAAARPIAYRFRGAKSLFPLSMDSDGQQTIVRWSADSALPAVAALVDRGQEQLVNGRMIGKDYVIEGSAPAYVFRLGQARATAVRQRSGPGK